MLTEALSIYREIGSRSDETDALNEAGTLDRVRGDLDQAMAYHRQAQEIFLRTGAAEAAEVAAELQALAPPRQAGERR